MTATATRPAFVSHYTPTASIFTVVVTRHNGRTFVTDAEGEKHARMLAESHVGGAGSTGWRAVVVSADGVTVGTYTHGTVKTNRGWAA